jgi:anti-repressor protein
MNELITLSTDTKFPVSGRDLHERLEAGTEYRHWFPRMCEYGFADDIDYRSKMTDRSDGLPGRQRIDHDLTISMAKEICMLQRTEMGRTIRRYLIAVEEQWNQPEAVMARALQMANDTIAKLNGNVLELSAANIKKDQLIGELKPKADYVDYILSSSGTMATSQIAADYSLSAHRLNRFLHEAGIQRKVGDQWILYTAHMGKGYTKSETIPISRSDGRPDTKMFTRWTQKGRLMINKVLNDYGIYANMDTGMLAQG